MHFDLLPFCFLNYAQKIFAVKKKYLLDPKFMVVLADACSVHDADEPPQLNWSTAMFKHTERTHGEQAISSLGTQAARALTFNLYRPGGLDQF